MVPRRNPRPNYTSFEMLGVDTDLCQRPPTGNTKLPIKVSCTKLPNGCLKESNMAAEGHGGVCSPHPHRIEWGYQTLINFHPVPWVNV